MKSFYGHGLKDRFLMHSKKPEALSILQLLTTAVKGMVVLGLLKSKITLLIFFTLLSLQHLANVFKTLLKEHFQSQKIIFQQTLHA